MRVLKEVIGRKTFSAFVHSNISSVIIFQSNRRNEFQLTTNLMAVRLIGMCESVSFKILFASIITITMEKQQKKVFLDLNHVFGSNFAQPIKNEIGLIEQDQQIKLVYTAGKTVVKKNLETSHMEFIRLSDNIDSIECMAISPTRNHISVCEKIKNENFLLLNLYGLKTRDSEIKHFKLPQTEKQSSFKVIAFSPSQPKYVCCMTSEPDNQLMFLDISRSRGLAVSNFSVQGAESLSICPTQSHLIACAGRNIFKLFKVEDYSFKQYDEVKKLPKTRNFMAQAWFDKTKILIGTDRGQLFMVGPVGNNFEVKRHFNNVFAVQSVQQIGVSSICVFSKGFILGSSKGHFSLWMKKEQDEENFEDEYTGDLIKKWHMPEDKMLEVTSIAICPREHNIAVSFKNNSIATTSMDILLATENQEDIENSTALPSDDVLSFLHGGFHTNSIDSMDICMHRPLIATLSKKENTIRIWNYKNPNCELAKQFDSKLDTIETAFGESTLQFSELSLINCVAFHPLGYYLAVGCCDKLRLYHLLQNSLRNYREVVLRGVVQLKFSHGGHMLAVAYPRQKHNIHMINVYNSYTMEEVARLSDHSNVITELCWRWDDKFLYSVGSDGTIAEWRHVIASSTTDKDASLAITKEWPCKKWNQNNSRYSSVICEKSGSVLACGTQLNNKNVIREIRMTTQNASQSASSSNNLQKLYTTSFKPLKLCFLTSQWNVPSILSGTSDGCLKVFNSSFDNIVEQSLNVHMKDITHIQTSPCGRYVFSASTDGMIFVYQVSLTTREGYVNKRLRDNEQQIQQQEEQLNPLIGVLDDELSEIVLVQRNDINEKIRYTKLLEKNLEDMRTRLIMQDDDEQRKYEIELRAIEAQKQETIDALNEQFEAKKVEKKELEVYFQNNFVNTQTKNDKMLEDIESLYEKKLAIENKKYFELEKNYEQQSQLQKQEIRKLTEKTRQTIEVLKKEFADCFKKAEKIHTSQQEAMVLGEKGFSEKVSQIEEEHENELRKISSNIAEIEIQKNKKSAEYCNTIQSLKRECRVLNDDIVHFLSVNEHERQLNKQAKAQLATILEEVSRKRKQLDDKQENLKARESKIGIFQQKISELQKKKQILSYRTWEMRQEIEPKEDEIEFLKEQIFSLETEFEALLNDEKVIKELSLKVQGEKQKLQKDIIIQKSVTKEKKAKIKKICDDINDLVNSKNSDRKFYEEGMSKLLQKYRSLMSEAKKNNRNAKGIEQMSRHMEHLDKEIGDVSEKTDVTIRKRDMEIQKSTQENADLIKELSSFRFEREELIDEFKRLQKVADSLKRQTAQLKNLSSVNQNQSTLKLGLNSGFSSQKQSMSRLSAKKAKDSSSSIEQQLPSNMNSGGNTNSAVSLIRASQSQPKGKLVKGINYDVESLSIFSKAKLKQLEGKLEMTKLNLRKREMMARVMKDKIQSHLKEECQDPVLERCLGEYEF